MYDIATQHANKLNGELSSAFVNVAEENATAQDLENSAISDSGIVQQMASAEAAAQRRSDDDDINDAAEEFDDTLAAEPSEPQPQVLALPIRTAAADSAAVSQQAPKGNQVQITSGYSVIS